MSILLDCQKLEKSFSGQPLFKDLSFSIHVGEKLGLVGRNGSGKSTFMKILAHQLEVDSGRIEQKNNIVVSYVPQKEDFPNEFTIERVLMESPKIKDDPDKTWKIEKVTSRLGMGSLDRKCGELSGGWKKRIAIAEALLIEPDLLLLDEPTNHLDIDHILWLENILYRAHFSWIVISHDRQFLQNTATRIAELSDQYDNGIYVSEGDYETFLTRRAAYREGLKAQADSMANRMRREDAWLHKGPKARTTKAKSRIDQAEKLRADLSKVKDQLNQKDPIFDFSASARKTRKLVELKNVRFSYDQKHFYGPFNMIVHNKLKLGILGRNGSGKSTLVKLLTKRVEPTEGTVIHADQLKVEYFDQRREDIPEETLLKYALAEDGKQVIVEGKPIHIVSWAQKFLFTPEQLNTPLAKLSGGEKAKVYLARLMARPADFLALDEPTNDLDIPALENLEESLQSFAGAALIISHDRYFLENVCDYFLGFNGQGELHLYNSFAHWLKETKKEQKKSQKTTQKSAQIPLQKPSSNKASPKPKNRLSYLDQREYDQMEKKILDAETAMQVAEKRLADPSIATDSDQLAQAAADYEQAKNLVEKLYTRWAELEQIQAGDHL